MRLMSQRNACAPGTLLARSRTKHHFWGVSQVCACYTGSEGFTLRPEGSGFGTHWGAGQVALWPSQVADCGLLSSPGEGSGALGDCHLPAPPCCVVPAAVHGHMRTGNLFGGCGVCSSVSLPLCRPCPPGRSTWAHTPCRPAHSLPFARHSFPVPPGPRGCWVSPQ